MNRAAVAATFAFAACSSNMTLRGAVTISRDSTDPAAGWEIQAYSRDLDVLGTATTDAAGVFSMELPRRTFVHLVVTGDGTIPLSFGGETGQLASYDLPTRTLWGFSEEDESAWRALFVGCDGADEAGNGMIIGITYPDLGIDYDYDGASPDPNGFAYIVDPTASDVKATRRDACYLDAEGDALAEGSDHTGASGKYAIFDVSDTAWSLVLGAFVGASGSTVYTSVSDVPTYVPPGGAAVRIPSLVTLQ